MNRNYKLRINFSDGSKAKIVLATYSLLISMLVGLKSRNDQTFTFTVSIFGNELDATDYRQLENAVSAWMDLNRSKAAMAVLDEAKRREASPYLYTVPMSAEEAQAISF